MSVELGFRLGKGALGIEQGERIHLALALLGADDPGRDFGLVARRLQRLAAPERIGIGRQRGLGFLQRAEHRAVELGQRLLRAGLGARDPGAGPGMVGEGPADQRAEQEADRVAEQIADAARRRIRPNRRG